MLCDESESGFQLKMDCRQHNNDRIYDMCLKASYFSKALKITLRNPLYANRTKTLFPDTIIATIFYILLQSVLSKNNYIKFVTF